MNDQKNTILAIVLSALVLIGWQYFVGMPQMEKQQQASAAAGAAATGPATAAAPQPGQARARCAGRPRRRSVAGQGAAPAARPVSARARPCSPPRRASRSRRRGSPARSRSRARRIDDLALTQYRETVDPKSPPIVLLSPSGSPQPFYAEFGWVPARARR